MKLALYLHVPFCRRKCPYCDFYSVTHPPNEEEYLRAVLTEARLWRERLPSPVVFITFYAGGGTPSLLSPGFYARLFEQLGKIFPFQPEELTLEANPEGLDQARLHGYLAAGFNRLSLGFQSLLPRGLAALGRVHSVEEARRAYFQAREAGYRNVSLDFIFGWPGQTLSLLEKELEEVIRLGAEHLSFYELTPEPGTPLFRRLQEGKLALPSEETLVRMHEMVRERLSSAGYEAYEISNYARPGFRCRHNLFYWKAQPYLGLGPAAASFLHRIRLRNPEDLQGYLRALKEDKLPARVEEELSEEGAFREAVILALRLSEGVKREEFLARFGRDPEQFFAREIRELKELGLLEVSPRGFFLSPRGRLLASQVQLKFL